MNSERISITGILGALALMLAIILGPALLGGVGSALAQTNDRAVEQESPQAGNVPGGHLGTQSDAEIWRAVRSGHQGTVSIPDKQAGVMIQSEGDNWRAWRNGPITIGGIWGLLIMIAVLALFFVGRGRIRIDAGPSGKTVERFNGTERFAHWLTAVSFVLLGLTGLNMLYGRHVLLPVLGNDAFAAITMAGKYVHNYISFAFMLGVVVMFVLWVRDNIPNKADLVWLAKAGGLFTKGVHPPSNKFNAGQKAIFWSVILGGLSLALSGISLLFPFELTMFAWSFKVLNIFGLGLATDISPMGEMQLSQLWHAAVGLIMIVIILAHIYIGSLGMEGAFAAMGTGHVDENWAREHHNLWVDEIKAKGSAASSGGGTTQPAE